MIGRFLTTLHIVFNGYSVVISRWINGFFNGTNETVLASHRHYFRQIVVHRPGGQPLRATAVAGALK